MDKGARTGAATLAHIGKNGVVTNGDSFVHCIADITMGKIHSSRKVFNIYITIHVGENDDRTFAAKFQANSLQVGLRCRLHN